MDTPAPPGLASEIEARRDELLDAIDAAVPHSVSVRPHERRQFFLGFLNVLAHAARGDDGPRDDYLGAIIPTIRSSGFMPLEAVLGQLVVVAMAVASRVAPEHLRWHYAFHGDYAARLVRAWEQA